MQRIMLIALLFLSGCATTSSQQMGDAAYQNKQYRVAAKHYAACARQGNPTCINNLGYIHELYGNKEKAIEHYTLAARFGDEYAINNLKKHFEPVPPADLQPPAPQQQASTSLLKILNAVIGGYNQGIERRQNSVVYCDSTTTGNSVNTVCTR
jgi:TPR repeat protein